MVTPTASNKKLRICNKMKIAGACGIGSVSEFYVIFSKIMKIKQLTKSLILIYLRDGRPDGFNV